MSGCTNGKALRSICRALAIPDTPQCPAGISYLLLEGLQVGLIGLPAPRLTPTYYPLQARGPVTANMAVGGHEKQEGSWSWQPPYRARPACWSLEPGSESQEERRGL